MNLVDVTLYYSKFNVYIFFGDIPRIVIISRFFAPRPVI